MPYSRTELAEHSRKIGRGWRTLQRWVARGCDLNDPASVQKFLAESERKKTNVRRYLEARGLTGVTLKARRRCVVRASGEFEASGNVDTLPPVGPRGAGATLRRLEKEEEEGHRRLQQALESGDQFAIDACQTYWLRVAEVLRRLDRELELSRRSEEEQIPLKTAQDAVTFVNEWLRISITTFLSAEGLTLAAGFPTIGDLKVYFTERFRGVMFMTL